MVPFLPFEQGSTRHTIAGEWWYLELVKSSLVGPFKIFLRFKSHEALYAVDVPDRFGCVTVPKDFTDFLQKKDQASGRGKDPKDKYSMVEFPYISFNREQFLTYLKPLMKGVKSFIDVGCGGGDKLELVKKLYPGVKVYGVEHDPCMAAWAGTYGDKVFCADAMTLDYKPYDLIYLYYPIQDRNLMDKLMKKIVETKKESTKILLLGFTYQHKDIVHGYTN